MCHCSALLVDFHTVMQMCAQSSSPNELWWLVSISFINLCIFVVVGVAITVAWVSETNWNFAHIRMRWSVQYDDWPHELCTPDRVHSQQKSRPNEVTIKILFHYFIVPTDTFLYVYVGECGRARLSCVFIRWKYIYIFSFCLFCCLTRAIGNINKQHVFITNNMTCVLHVRSHRPNKLDW